MRALRWVLSAASVSGGIAFWATHRIGSPALAAQPASGIAYSGRSYEATSTTSDGAPAAADCRRSTAAATAAGEPAGMSVVRKPATGARVPTRITCAPPAALAPFGASRSSAAAVASGTLSPLANRIGARIGALNSTDAASPVRQSLTSASTTASGLASGNAASATPAASAIASPPATRVVFRLATTG